MQVDVDRSAGFCFGVVEAIRQAEELLDAGEELYCLGQPVHNEEELKRLERKGLKYVSIGDFPHLRGKKVLIRAHGEPPETYRLAEDYGIELIDGTCPIVLKLQERIHQEHEADPSKQIVIFGKPQHPESIGLNGQTGHQSRIVEDEKELEKIDPSGPVSLYSQTTMDTDRFEKVKQELQSRMADPDLLKCKNTICGQMKRRKPALKEFAQNHDVIVFVSGKNSSNGKFLYSVAKEQNPRSHFISGKEEIDPGWFEKDDTIGVSGATSTPQWLLEEIAKEIRNGG